MKRTVTKKKYELGDTVWIYGVSSGPGFNRPVKGTVVHQMDIEGFSGTHYVIAIDTDIETLLEVRTWETISQDAKGPVGSFRETLTKFSPTRKLLSRTGLILPVDDIYEDKVDEQDNESDQN